MTALGFSTARLRATAAVVILLVSATLMPQITGSDAGAGLLGSSVVSLLAALYAWSRRKIIGPRWALLGLGATTVWVAALAILLLAPLAPGGATAS